MQGNHGHFSLYSPKPCKFLLHTSLDIKSNKHISQLSQVGMATTQEVPVRSQRHSKGLTSMEWDAKQSHHDPWHLLPTQFSWLHSLCHLSDALVYPLSSISQSLLLSWRLNGIQAPHSPYCLQPMHSLLLAFLLLEWAFSVSINITSFWKPFWKPKKYKLDALLGCFSILAYYTLDLIYLSSPSSTIAPGT